MATRVLARAAMAVLAMTTVLAVAERSRAQYGATAMPAPVQDANATGGYPVPVVERPLTLNERMLRIDVGFAFSRVEACTDFGGCIGTTPAALAAGVSYGIIDDLEVGAVVLPLLLSPAFDYSGPEVKGTYRFLRGDTEIGLSASITLPVNTSFAFSVGAPVWLRFLPRVLLQTGAFLYGYDAATFGLGLNVPFSALVQVLPSLWAGVDTGFEMQFNDPGPGKTFTVPLGVQVGYAIPGSVGKPVADLLALFGFPSFFTPGAGEVVSLNLWAIGLAARVYLYL